MSVLQLRGLYKPLCLLVFVCGFAVPTILLLFYTNGHDMVKVHLNEAQTALDTNKKNNLFSNAYGHERKPLDYLDSSDGSQALRFQIHEMQQIKASVRNELRQLEKERTSLNQEVQKYEDHLASLKKELNSARSELQESKTKLARTIRETNRASKGGGYYSPNINPAPVVIVDVPYKKPRVMLQKPVHETVSTTESCTFDSCFDFSRCPLLKSFSVYVYNNHQPFNEQFVLRSPHILEEFTKSLSDKHTITNDPKEACILVIIIGPLKTALTNLQETLQSLPYWNNNGANHVVIDLSHPDNKISLSTLRNYPVGQAIFVSMWPHRPGYDILVPPVRLEKQMTNGADPKGHDQWKRPSPHLPAFRSTLLNFGGDLEKFEGLTLGEDDLWISVDDITTIRDAVLTKSKDKLLIETNCESYLKDFNKIVPDTRGIAFDLKDDLLGEWKLCGTEQHRSSSLTKSTFALILGSKSGFSGTATYTRLIEALYSGSIPVIVGVKSLPFEQVIDWTRAVVRIPPPRIGEMHYILRSLEPDKILEYRRQGWFLWNTYFSSTRSVFDAVLAIVRFRSLHPPPFAPDYVNTKLLISLPFESRQTVSSALHVQNFSIYSTDFWNTPPGPMYMYPVSPFKSSPVSGSQYEGLTDQELSQLPTHVIQAGGITGPYFEDYLLGNSPEEQFTVVMLTYERNDVLIQAIYRLDELHGLAKVVVVWNSPSPPPDDLKWPTIGVPVEVVSVGKNSLNNRFLPLSNIQTEAVLSIDDDVHLRHDEIQFAFRVWREARDRIVGFPGRFHARDVKHSSWLYNSNYTCELSMVLTGAAFIHKYYFYLYSEWMPKVIRDIVEEYINCEDIAMNFLVSHITRKPPLKVTSRWTFRCPGCPENLSSNEEHFNERHICMNRFVEVYGYMPLLYTQFRLDSVLFKTRLPSHLEKCYTFV